MSPTARARSYPTTASSRPSARWRARASTLKSFARSEPNVNSRVTIHMAASLDGFIARQDGRVDWLETSDEFAGGATLEPGFVAEFLKTIDCYVMGSRTYET